MSNPIDLLEVARDAIRKEEAEHLFKVVQEEREERDGNVWPPTAREGYIAALDEVLLIIDARIGYLRSRWEDSGVL